MPNWVDNRLRIIGEEEHLAEFRKWLAEDCGGEFLFEKFAPIPQELLDNCSPNRDEQKAEEFKSKYGAADWYSWACENWGTKWDLKQQDDDFLGNFDEYQGFCFDTAWSPPFAAIQNLNKKFPNLKFEMDFIDESWLFWGTCTIEKSELQETSYELEDLREDDDYENSAGYKLLIEEFESDEEWVKERIEEWKKDNEED